MRSISKRFDRNTECARRTSSQNSDSTKFSAQKIPLYTIPPKSLFGFMQFDLYSSPFSTSERNPPVRESAFTEKISFSITLANLFFIFYHDFHLLSMQIYSKSMEINYRFVCIFSVKIYAIFAPLAVRMACKRATSISLTGLLLSQASEAATPAASPSVQQVGMMRNDACASWVAEMHLPATRRNILCFLIICRHQLSVPLIPPHFQ